MKSSTHDSLGGVLQSQGEKANHRAAITWWANVTQMQMQAIARVNIENSKVNTSVFSLVWRPLSTFVSRLNIINVRVNPIASDKSVISRGDLENLLRKCACMLGTAYASVCTCATSKHSFFHCKFIHKFTH